MTRSKKLALVIPSAAEDAAIGAGIADDSDTMEVTPADVARMHARGSQHPLDKGNIGEKRGANASSGEIQCTAVPTEEAEPQSGQSTSARETLEPGLLVTEKQSKIFKFSN